MLFFFSHFGLYQFVFWVMDLSHENRDWIRLDVEGRGGNHLTAIRVMIGPVGFGQLVPHWPKSLGNLTANILS